MSQQDDKSFYFLTLKPNTAKSGKTYYTGKYAYAIDIVGFTKPDGSISLRLSPKPMDQVKQQNDARQGQHPYSPQVQATPKPRDPRQNAPPPKNYAPQSEEPPPWDDQDPNYPEFK